MGWPPPNLPQAPLSASPDMITKSEDDPALSRIYPEAFRPDAGYKASMEVFAEHEAKSPMFKKIHQDMRAFQRDQLLWERFSEFRYNSYMTGVKL